MERIPEGESFENALTPAEKALADLLDNDNPKPEPKKNQPPVVVQKRRQPKPQPALEVDRLPPHSIECEQGILGCILSDPAKCLDAIVEKIKSNADAFYDLRHQLIWKSVLAMSDERIPIEIISLHQRLKDTGRIEEVGGIPYLSQLQDAVPSASNWSYYADTILDMQTRRRLIASCTEVVSKAYGSAEVGALVGDVEKVFHEGLPNRMT